MMHGQQNVKCLCVCVCVCVRKTLWMRGPWPPRGAVAPKNKQTNKINQTSTVCNLLPSAGTVAYRNATIPIISCFLHSPRGGFWSGRPANKLFSCNTYFHISFYQQVLTGDFTLSLVSPTQVTRLGTIGTASLKIKFPPPNLRFKGLGKNLSLFTTQHFINYFGYLTPSDAKSLLQSTKFKGKLSEYSPWEVIGGPRWRFGHDSKGAPFLIKIQKCYHLGHLTGSFWVCGIPLCNKFRNSLSLSWHNFLVNKSPPPFFINN